MLPRLTRRRTVFALGVLLASGLAVAQLWAWYHLRAARVALEEYRPEAARTNLAACANVWPNRVVVHLLSSRAARQAGDFDLADRELRACRRLSGEMSDEIAFEWALLQAAGANVREVEDYLQARVDRDPRLGPIVWEALVEGYLRIFRTIDAMAMVDHWLAVDPENIRALELRGVTFVTGRGVKRGSDDLREVIARDPERRATRWTLITCLLDLGGYKEALTHLAWFDRVQPGDPEILARMARCEILLVRKDDAIRHLNAAIAADAANPLVARTWGQFALAENQPAEAERWLRQAATTWPNDYRTQFMLFLAINRQGKEREQEAEAQLKITEEVRDRAERVGELRSRKLGEQPLDPALHVEMGLLQARANKPADAERWFLAALALDPNFAPAHAALADHYERAGDTARAAMHRAKAAQP